MLTLLKRFLSYFSSNGVGTGEDGAKTLLSGIVLNLVEWKIVGLAFAGVTLLKFSGVSGRTIFLLLWVGDVILSMLILTAERVSGIDITFMDAYRRTVTYLSHRFRYLSYPLILGLFLFILVWYGPAYIAAYYKNHLYHRPAHLYILVVLLAGVQMALWTPAYLAGVDLLTYLLNTGG